MKDKTTNKKTSKLTTLFKLPRHYVAYRVYKKNKNLPGIYRNLKKLAPIYRKSPSYHYRLSKLAFHQKLWKQALNHINTAIKLGDNNSVPIYYKCKANCLIKMEEVSKATSCLNKYLLSKPNDDQAWLQLAMQYSGLRQWQQSADGFETYLKLQPEDSNASYLLGECYFKLNNFEYAENHYQQATKNLDKNRSDQSLACTYYKLGLMQFKNSKTDQANKSFEKAISLDQKLKSQRFGIGVFHEHFKQWEYVVEAYEKQLAQCDTDAELLFKLASILDGMGWPKSALKYYERALHFYKIQAKWHYALANCYEQLEDYKNAAIWYNSAIDRQQKHTPEWYRRLGFTLEKLGNSNQALLAYQEADLFRRPSDIDSKFYEKYISNSTTRYAISYEYYQIDDKMIFYESMAGSRLMCNPLALFRKLIQDEKFQDYTHVWCIKSFSNIPEEYQSFNNVLFVKRDTDLYRRYSSTAKFIITNSKLSKHLTRKPEQKLLDTWHGTAYKTIGGHDKASPYGFKNANRVFLSTTHILTPNPHMSKTQPDCYQFKYVYSGEMAEEGYPRIDSTINITSKEKYELADELNVNLEKPIVLYAPTWRGTYSNNVYDVSKLQNDLERLAKLDVQIIFRGHHLSEKHIKGKLNDNIKVVPPNIDSNKLLGVVDLLITDYSSIFFDYLVTDKPIIHYLYDLDEYTKNRGMYFGVDELPGDVAYTVDEVVKFVEHDLGPDYKPSKRYEIAKQRFCPHEDGQVSDRVIDWFICGKSRDINIINTGKRPSILVYGGNFSPGEKTDEFIKKVSKLDHTKYNIDVVIPSGVAGSAEKTQQSKLLPEQTMIMPYTDGMIMTLHERKAIEYYNKHDEFADNDMKRDYDRAFAREVRRVLGDSHFIETIDYAGDSKFWKSFLNSVSLTK